MKISGEKKGHYGNYQAVNSFIIIEDITEKKSKIIMPADQIDVDDTIYKVVSIGQEVRSVNVGDLVIIDPIRPLKTIINDKPYIIIGEHEVILKCTPDVAE